MRRTVHRLVVLVLAILVVGGLAFGAKTLTDNQQGENTRNIAEQITEEP